jgi:hypothetical protein
MHTEGTLRDPKVRMQWQYECLAIRNKIASNHTIDYCVYEDSIPNWSGVATVVVLLLEIEVVELGHCGVGEAVVVAAST